MDLARLESERLATRGALLALLPDPAPAGDQP